MLLISMKIFLLILGKLENFNRTETYFFNQTLFGVFCKLTWYLSLINEAKIILNLLFMLLSYLVFKLIILSLRIVILSFQMEDQIRAIKPVRINVCDSSLALFLREANNNSHQVINSTVKHLIGLHIVRKPITYLVT